MLAFVLITLIVLTHVCLYVYCDVRKAFAPEYTNTGDRTFAKMDWEMSGIFSLIFGLGVPLVWLVRIGFLAVTDGLKAIANFFVNRINRQEEERRRKAEEVVPVKGSYSYRKEAQ